MTAIGTLVQGNVIKTKDFAAVAEGAVWYIVALGGHLRGLEPERWLMSRAQWSRHEPGALLAQFYSDAHKRFEAADDDEAYALLHHVQKTYSIRNED
jgi:hypothetical protein